MNDHAGWTQEGRCVFCASKTATGPCDPYARILELELAVQLNSDSAMSIWCDAWREEALRARAAVETVSRVKAAVKMDLNARLNRAEADSDLNAQWYQEMSDAWTEAMDELEALKGSK